MRKSVIALSLIILGVLGGWYQWSQQQSIIDVPLHWNEQQTPLLEMSAVPVASSSAHPAQVLPQLTAESVYVLDVNSGSQLLVKDPDTLRAPASTVKLMTALVAREVYAQQEIITVGEETFTPGNTVSLVPGQLVTVSDLLYAMLVASGNDAAEVLATHHPQGEAGFIAEMNQHAKKMGLENTHFENPSGLDHPRQRTTAHELAIIAQQAFNDQLLAPMLSAKQYQITGPDGAVQQYLWNTNQLLGSDQGIFAGKTGTTEEAGQVLVSLAEVKGEPVVVVVMGSYDRYVDTQLIMSWLDQSYEWYEPTALELDTPALGLLH